MAREMRPVQRATQGPQPRSVPQILITRGVARMLDRPYRWGTAILTVVTWWMLTWWAALIVLVIGLAMCYVLRGVERERAVRRRFVRAWRGEPERPGLAHDLDLVNRSGVVPKIAGYTVGKDSRVIRFTLPAGITAAMFEKQADVIADALGAHRAEVQAPAPGVCEFVAIDRDALAEPVQSEWSREVEAATPEAEDYATGGTPYWLQDGQDRA